MNSAFFLLLLRTALLFIIYCISLTAEFAGSRVSFFVRILPPGCFYESHWAITRFINGQLSNFLPIFLASSSLWFSPVATFPRRSHSPAWWMDVVDQGLTGKGWEFHGEKMIIFTHWAKLHAITHENFLKKELSKKVIHEDAYPWLPLFIVIIMAYCGFSTMIISTNSTSSHPW